jgi:hypothetical protein
MVLAALGFVLATSGCEDPQTQPPQRANPSASNSDAVEAGAPRPSDSTTEGPSAPSSEASPSAPDAAHSPSVDTGVDDASSLVATPDGGDPSAAWPTLDAAPTCAVDACNDQGTCIRRGQWTVCNCAPDTLPICTLPHFRAIGPARTNQERVLTLLSGDGRVAAGTHAFDRNGWESVGVTWTPSDGLQPLEQPAFGSAIPTAINDDGSVIVGVMVDDHDRDADRNEPNAVLWHNGVLVPFSTDAGVLPERNPIPELPRTTIPEQTFEAFDATENGRIVVGKAKRGTTPRFQFEAAVWVRDRGVYFLHDVLPARGVSLVNWRLWHVSAVSNDGSTMTGLGLGPDVGYRWYLRLPNDLFD